MKKFYILTALFLSTAVLASADEGMWMTNLIDKALEAKMREAGSHMSANVIYDEEQGGLADAIVSLDFQCSGSLISKEGLVITNHHCAYSDVFKLSTQEHNYLEDGFWASRRNEEIPVPGRSFYILRKALDVTEEVQAHKDSLYSVFNKNIGMRKLSHDIEKRYKKSYPGKDVSLYQMYAGEKYYLMVYEVYRDVRLVAAPPVCIGSFGGDIDNWEWPQHKGDFAIYRIYTAPDGSGAAYSADNVPLHPSRTLKVSTKGVRKGDFTMTLGYPGTTNRFASSFETDALSKEFRPLVASLQKERMDIYTKWMNADKNVRLKYADAFFMLSNVQEIYESEAQCLINDGVSGIIAGGREKQISEGLLDSLKCAYEAAIPIDRQIKYFQECSVRSGKLFKWSILCGKKGNDDKKKEWLEKADLRVEKEIFLLNIKEIYENINSIYWGKYLTKVFAEHGEDAGRWMWDNSSLATDNPLSAGADDPVVASMQSMNMAVFSKARAVAEGAYALDSLRREYKRAVYRNNLASGACQYPDANSTLRLSYGNVRGLSIGDAAKRRWFSSSREILKKYNPSDYNYTLKEDLIQAYRKGDWGRWADKDGKLHVNFISANDITGGNSGSPVVNADGELVGLAFDGNKEGLSCDIHYNQELNRCVCVDIRYVLWVLDKYAGMNGLIDEILN